MGGIVRTIPVGSRTVNAGFFGVGLPHLGVEALIAMSNKLLMHYGCQTAAGKLMQTSYSLLFLELGLSFHPLQESYDWFESLVTHSWVKMLWEKLSKFKVRAVVANIQSTLPRDSDQFIMQVLIQSGYSIQALLRLNHVRVCQQTLFMLDVLTASGNKVNPEVLNRQPPGEAWSNMTWPTEHPTDSDFQLRRRAIASICPSQNSRT
jgi:hypothetical protein